MTSKHFIATVMGLAMTVTSISAMPARALSEQDLAKLLFGATALVIIGAAVNNDKKHKPAPVAREHHSKPRETHRAPRSARHALPARCGRTFRLQGGHRVHAYGKNCLSQANVNQRHLPSECRFNATNQYGRTVRGYKTHCLKRNGFDVSWR
jgi:hypothetical protein